MTDDVLTDAVREAEAKALSSVVRLRILRLCLDESLTNKELAERLGLNPATCLHHVRTLVEHDFLRAEEPRRGRRGAKEIPYRSTLKSWRTKLGAGQQRIIIQAFLDEFALTDPEDARMWRLGVRLTPERREQMLGEFGALLEKYATDPADEGGEPWSLLFVAHPDTQRE